MRRLLLIFGFKSLRGSHVQPLEIVFRPDSNLRIKNKPSKTILLYVKRILVIERKDHDAYLILLYYIK